MSASITNRFAIVPAGPLLLRTIVTVGGVSGRGATELNVVSPYFEAFWIHGSSDVTLHLVWNLQATRSGAGGWRRQEQVALFADRALFLKLFK